jgi:hypothetical protein
VVAVLLVISGAALGGHVPVAGFTLPAGAIGGTAAWVLAGLLLVAATFVAARPRVTRERFEVPTVRVLVAGGVSLTLLVELVAMWLPHRGAAAVLTGVVVGLVLLGICGYLGVVIDSSDAQDDPDEVGDSLQHWVVRTESLIGWSETSRADWDRRVRPVLAQQFEVATKASQRRAVDPAAFELTGRMLFGADLWKWVDPDNVVRGGGLLPGPGRHTLERIIDCLEQV